MSRVITSRGRLELYVLVALWLIAAIVLVPKVVSADEERPPMFIADKTEVAVGEVVTFTNQTTGGTHPYVKAEWDFNADGIADITLSGTEAQVMAPVTHAYTANGLYTVRLVMTDSTPTIGHEDRIDYILVSHSECPSILWWDCPIGGGTALIAPYPANGRGFLRIAALCEHITVTFGGQLWGIYYLDEAVPGGEWLYYIPGFVSSTITQLEPDQYYYVIVSDACSVAIPQY